jgi:hypothetical protein
MARDELFAGLCFLGCVNGLAGHVIQSIDRVGWATALLAGFDISAIVWYACCAGLLLLVRERRDAIRPADLLAASGSLILIMLPNGGMSWLAVTGLSLYMLLFTNAGPPRHRGAVILLATTVPMLWSRLAIGFLADPILDIDASLVGRVLGTDRVGHMVRFADGSGFMAIWLPCSSLVNASYAFLCWVVISQVVGHRWSPRDLLWCSAACVAMIAANVMRLSFMALSIANYTAIHSQWGYTVASLIELGLAVGICLFGVRHELFARA